MALRLIDSPAAAAAPSAASPDVELLARLRAALAARDLEAVRAVPAATAGIEDPHRRYVARRTVVELILENAFEGGATAPLVMLAAARAALEVLSPAPAEPVILNLAGVALYELGALKGAEALYEAARTLDPDLPNVDRNLREIRRHRGERVRLNLPAAVTVHLKDLERRAADVARRARPSATETISLCMIVRDEEEMLGRCLAAATPAVDEVIVVDTGSTDRTIEIAREHGARVVEHVWGDDFAEARNVGLELATSDWILFLDADEVLVAEDAPRLRELTRRSWREAFTLTLTNYVGDVSEGTALNHDGLRLFRNRPTHRFEGRIHEGVLSRLPAGAPEKVESSGVRVEHYGYLRQTREARDKSRRNLALLERQVEESAPSSYLSYNLGSEYAALADVAQATEHFGRAWELMEEENHSSPPGFAPSLVARYVGSLRAAGRLDEAYDMTVRGLELFPGFTDLVFEQAQMARSRGETARAKELLRECLELGDAPSRYAPVVGAGTFLAANALANLLLEEGDAAAAEALLLDALAEHPKYVATVPAAAAAMLARGAEPAEVLAVIGEHVGTVTSSMRFLVAGALHEVGRAAEAAELLERVLADEPGADAARIALAEAHLSQRAWAEAAAVAGDVPHDGSWARTAAVSECFARIMLGETEAALAAAERAGDPDAPLLGAWAAAAAGTPTDDRMPFGSLPLLVTALEALVRVEEIDAFVTLLPLMAQVDGLTPRARREVLAKLYLRRGLLDSAADEWAAACEEAGPDAAALTGLARVAAARGDAADALVFAEGALEIDPDERGAARVLRELSAA